MVKVQLITNLQIRLKKKRYLNTTAVHSVSINNLKFCIIKMEVKL